MGSDPFYFVGACWARRTVNPSLRVILIGLLVAALTGAMMFHITGLIRNSGAIVAGRSEEPRVLHPWLFSPMPDVPADADNPFTLTHDKHFAAVIALNADIRRDLHEVLKQLAAVAGALQPGQDMTVTVVYRDQSH